MDTNSGKKAEPRIPRITRVVRRRGDLLNAMPTQAKKAPSPQRFPLYRSSARRTESIGQIRLEQKPNLQQILSFCPKTSVKSGLVPIVPSTVSVPRVRTVGVPSALLKSPPGANVDSLMTPASAEAAATVKQVVAKRVRASFFNFEFLPMICG